MNDAQVAELVDALVSNTNIERCAGSSPALGTSKGLSRNAEAFFWFETFYRTIGQKARFEV